MSDSQKPEAQKPAPSDESISPLTRVPTTPEAHQKSGEDQDLYNPPKKTPKPSVFSPFDKITGAKPGFEFEKPDVAVKNNSTSVATPSGPPRFTLCSSGSSIQTPVFKPAPQNHSTTSTPQFWKPSNSSVLSKTSPAYSTPSSTGSSVTPGPFFGSSPQYAPSSPASSVTTPASSNKPEAYTPYSVFDNLPATPSPVPYDPTSGFDSPTTPDTSIDASSAVPRDAAKTTVPNPSILKQAATSSDANDNGTSDNDSPAAPNTVKSPTPITGTAAATSTIDVTTSGDDAATIAPVDDKVRNADKSNKCKNKPLNIPKTWDNAWFRTPLPGPKPEWRYAMPTEEPKPSRAYRTNNLEGSNESEKLVFKDQDDAPYTAMGTSWANDEQAHARFIWKRLQQNDMTLEQAKAQYEIYKQTHEFLKDRKASTEPSTMLSKTIRTMRSIFSIPTNKKLVAPIDPEALDWIRKACVAQEQTIRYSWRQMKQRVLALWSLLLAIFWSFCYGVVGLVSWAYRKIRAGRWWLLAAIVVFLVAFGVTNDWFGSVGFHQYYTALAQTSNVTSTSQPVLTTPTTELPAPRITARPALSDSSLMGLIFGFASPSKNIWNTVTSVNLPSSIPQANVDLPSWVTTAPMTRAFGSSAGQLLEWVSVFMTFWLNNAFSSFITDLRVIVSLICVFAILGLYYVWSARIQAISNKGLAKANSAWTWTKNAAIRFGTAVSTYATGTTWPAITNKFSRTWNWTSTIFTTIWAFLTSCPRKLKALVCNIPYILVWVLANPFTSVKVLLSYALVYIVWLAGSTLNLFLFCILWPIFKVLDILIWLISGLMDIWTASCNWFRRQWVSLKTWWKTRGGDWGEWPIFWWTMDWVGWFCKLWLVLVVFGIVMFTMGLGWRDIYEGFEKVVIEVAPC